MAERKVSRFERNMESFGTWVEKYVAPPLVKFGNQKHMAAIRTAYIRIIPFIIVGSVRGRKFFCVFKIGSSIQLELDM